jgi:hypothetical protein
MSNNILYTPTGSAYNTILIVPSGQTAEEVATQGGWAPSEWAEFDAESYITNYNDYKQAFSIVDNQPLANTVAFSLPAAKVEASNTVKAQYANLESSATEGYSANQLSSQASLPEVNRLPEIQAVLDAVNVLAVTLSANLAAIDAATDINEVNNVVNPPTGILSTGRGAAGPLDLNNSYYTEFNSSSLTESETELYVPGTSTVIPYGSIPGGFDSAGDCFATGDYLVQIREVATSRVISEFVCPLAPANEDVAF